MLNNVERDAYVYLVDVDAAGKVTVLFPNIYAKDNFVKAGIVHEMPAPNLYRFRSAARQVLSWSKQLPQPGR